MLTLTLTTEQVELVKTALTHWQLRQRENAKRYRSEGVGFLLADPSLNETLARISEQEADDATHLLVKIIQAQPLPRETEEAPC